MIKINSMANLLALPNRWNKGDQALITDTHELYVYDNGWTKCGSTEITISAMDLLKQNLANAPELDMTAIEKAREEIHDYVLKTRNRRFVLMNKDINYWTFFITQSNTSNLSKVEYIDAVIIELLDGFGEIVAADISDDTQDVCYFYVRTKKEKEILVFVFFPYDGGTIECFR